MTSKSNLERMEIMHLMCQRELEQLQMNLSRFLLDSEAIIRHDTFANSRKDFGASTRENVFVLMAYDRYMSRLATATNLARKFNLQLQLHDLNKVLTGNMGVEMAPASYFFGDFVEWNALKSSCDGFINASDCKSFRKSEGIKCAPIELKGHIEDSGKTEIPTFVRKIRFATPDSLIFETLPACVLLRDLSSFVPGYHFAATITNIDGTDPLCFYVSQMRNDTLFELCNMFNLPKYTNIPPTNVVFGISIDSKSILRGVLQSPKCDDGDIDVEKSRVLLIDYGEPVSLDNNFQFYNLSKVYRDLPAQAIKCILVGVKTAPSEKQLTDNMYLAKTVRNYEFREATFEVVQKNGRILYLYLVENNQEIDNLFNKLPYFKERKCERISLNPFRNTFDENLIKETCTGGNGGSPQVEPGSNVNANSNHELNFSLKPRIEEVLINGIIYLEVMHIVRPDCFYAQILKDKIEQLEPLFWNTNEVLKQKLAKPPKLGDVILARYAKDEFWYRAKVIGIDDGSTFKVFYVDYGNTESVSLECTATCNNAQETIPFRAVPCRFADVPDLTCDNLRFEQAVQMLVVMLLNQRIKVQVAYKNDRGELHVRLLDKEFDEIIEILVNLGCVKEI